MRIGNNYKFYWKTYELIFAAEFHIKIYNKSHNFTFASFLANQTFSQS